MTDKELIEAQENDIRNLLSKLREKDEQLELAKNNALKYGVDFEFDTPYYRIDSYHITCYRLVNIVTHKWYLTSEPQSDVRFSEVFNIRLSDGKFFRGCGGNKALKTCITYRELESKLNRRYRIALSKCENDKANLLNDILKTVRAETNNCSAIFKEEV